MKSQSAAFAALLATVCLLSPRSSASEYSITERGPHHAVWSRTVSEPGPGGQTINRTHSFVELSGGMNYLEDGEWRESKELVESFPGGAIARYGQTRVAFANNLATAGAIDIQTHDGKRLQSHFLAVRYVDLESGSNVLVSLVKDSQGHILQPNQVLYDDALSGLSCTIRYTYTKSGLEQDLILLEPPPSPSDYGLGETTVLETITEFIPSELPLTTSGQLALDGVTLTDESISFGITKLGRGRTFLLGSAAQRPPEPTAKRWVTHEGRYFLIEAIPVSRIRAQFEELHASSGTSEKTGVANNHRTTRLAASRQPVFPKILPARLESKKAMTLATSRGPDSGLVLDYFTVVTTNNFVFSSDKTYYVSGPVTLSGNTVIMGGAVIKRAPTNNPCIAFDSGGTLEMRTGPYSICVITSRDNDNVGEIIPGSTGNPQRTPGTALAGLMNGAALRYTRFAHIETSFSSSVNNSFWHCQFVDCSYPIVLGLGVSLYNVLFSNCGTNITFLSSACGYPCAPTVLAEHTTADNCTTFLRLVGSWLGTPVLTLRNSILTAVGTLTSGVTISVTTNSSAILPTNSGVFAAVGGGNYYLASSSTNRDAGGTNINASLLADLRKKTSFPPTLVAAQIISTNTTLSPHVQRDTDIPDRGYHYDTLDFEMGWVAISGSATLNITPGTAIACFGTNSGSYGVGVGDNARLECKGTPTDLCHFVQYTSVQESAGPGFTKPWYALVTDQIGTPAGINFRFTDFSVTGQDAPHFFGANAPVNFQDCQFHGGSLTAWIATVCLTNCLLERVLTDLEPMDDYVPVIRNNTVVGGWFNFLPLMAPNSYIKNNIFDGCSFTNDLTSIGCDGGYNAFYPSTARMKPDYASNKLLSTSPGYRSGTLSFYFLSTTNTALINTGSATADTLGLYHYTVSTNLVSGVQIKETNSWVDLGFHLAVTDGSGNPIDTDGDGVIDVLEDLNGNGLVDGGENSWTNYNSPNGLGTGFGLQVFTPLK